MADINSIIANRLKAAREHAGLNKVEIASLLGLSKQGYNPYEQGRRVFTIEQLVHFSMVLRRPVAYFLGIDEGLDAEAEELLYHYRRIQDPILREAARDAVRREAEIDKRLRAQRGDHSD